MARVICFLLLIFSIDYSYGQMDYNPNSLPMGDVEALLANTGTGGVSSPGAVYYNPAALVMLEGTSFSLNGSAYLKYESKAEPLTIIGGKELDYKADGFLTIPTSIAIVKEIRNVKVAFSALVPFELNFEGPKNWNVPVQNQELNIRILQNVKQRLFMAGFSVAGNLGNDWSLGGTLYWQAYSLLDVNDMAITLVGNPVFLSQSSRRTDINVNNLMAIIGLQKQFEKWNLGLKIDLPTIELSDRADIYRYDFSNFNGNNVGGGEFNLKTDANYKSPVVLRLGATFAPSESLLIASDLSYQFNQDYSRVTLPTNDIKSEVSGSYRGSLGIQKSLSEKIKLMSGFSTAMAEVDKVDRAYWSTVLALKLSGEHTSSSIGLFYSKENAEVPIESQLQKTKSQTVTYGVFLGTNYRF